jgi:ribosomal-protein-alanine N-acetyltransferase
MSNHSFPYVVEPMTLADVPEVMAIERESFPLPWSENTYRHELRGNQHSHYLVVRPVGSPLPVSFWERLVGRGRKLAPVLGYGGFWLIADEAHISTIAVAARWRGYGLGELLLVTMIEQGLQKGAHIVTLEVRVSNAVAQNLYRKYGFVTVGERKHYYRDNGENAFIMTVDEADGAQYAQQFQALRGALRERLGAQSTPDKIGAGQRVVTLNNGGTVKIMGGG